MLFASINAFGIDQKPVQAKEFSTSGQSEHMTPVSSVKDKCRELFEISRSNLENNKLLSENAKLLYSNLKFKDIWEEINRIFCKDPSGDDGRASDVKDILSGLKQIFGENSSEEKNIKILLNQPRLKSSFSQIVKGTESEGSFRQRAIESAAKRSAKLFYKNVLGNSELSEWLYKKAEYEIDSAKLVKCQSLNVFGSFNSALGGIKCEYYDYDDLFFSLIHEVGHGLDWTYGIRKTFGRPITKIFEKLHLLENRQFFGYSCAWYYHICNQRQLEYVPMLFETLLRSSVFKGKLYSSDSSAHRFRLYEIYIDFVQKNFAYELLHFYNKDQLNNLVSILTKPHTLGEIMPIISELRKHDEIGAYINNLRECSQILDPKYESALKYFEDIIKKGESQWRELLRRLDDNGHTDLSRLFRDIEKGESKMVAYSIILDSNILGSLTFEKDSKEIEKQFPKIDGINWGEIWQIADAKLWVFLEKCEYLLRYATELVDGIEKEAEGILNIEDHIEGKYNAFRLIKEKGYFDLLESGKSLPIEEVMEELTKPLGSLNITEELAKEFLEVLKK